jgi:uncharacterized protein (DUF1800 family)
MDGVTWSAYAEDERRCIAGHLLRRIGFGPSPRDMDEVLAKGFEAYVAEQLDPESVDDSALEAMLPDVSPTDLYGAVARWYLRMLASRRQLLEKMTLFWHEHFATSLEKVLFPNLMRKQEELFRRHALGSFPELLVEITKDAAMLVWLDNGGNDGRARDADGDPIPPNENYARELLQLFALGTVKLNLDGTPVLDGTGRPEPAFSENDVKEIARALTGWGVKNNVEGKVQFFPKRHAAGPWVVFGETLQRRRGKRGARTIDDVVSLIMKQPTVAAFVARELILKFATETPSGNYVERVATAFRDTNGDIRETMRALVNDPEFVDDSVIRSQYKTPIEHVLGSVRGLSATTYGRSLFVWCREARELVYFPPSVFSFYRPGQKGALVDTHLVFVRDRIADKLANNVEGAGEAFVDVAGMITSNALDTPEKAVDFLAATLLAAPLAHEARAAILGYMDGLVTEGTMRGAIWLVLCSPDYQRN